VQLAKGRYGKRGWVGYFTFDKITGKIPHPGQANGRRRALNRAGCVKQPVLPIGSWIPMKFDTHKPRLIFWEVTKGCNLRCVHCRATATELSSPNDLPKTKALNIIKQISQLSLPIIVLSGGEPLFRTDIFELASYARDCGLRVALATNGTLVTQEIARKIVDSGVRRVLHQSRRSGRRDPRCLSRHPGSV